MGYFAVVREAGAAWSEGGIADQDGVADHAAFMSALAEENFVLFAGPLAGTEQDRVRALVIVNTESEADIHDRLSADPWAQTGHLQTVSVEVWNPFVGLQRLEQ